MAEPEGDGCGDADGREEGACSSVIAGVGAAPVFQAAEHDLDLVVLAVERRVVRMAILRLAVEGMQAAMPHSSSTLGRPLPSRPLSAISSFVGAKALSSNAAPR